MEANGLICVLGTWLLCNGCLLVVDLITNRENIRANWLKKIGLILVSCVIGFKFKSSSHSPYMGPLYGKQHKKKQVT